MQKLVGVLVILLFISATSCRYDEPAALVQASTSGITSVASHYVATWGLPSNNGTFSSPWTLEYALKGAAGQIHAGDTVWVRGSTTHGDPIGVYEGDPATPHRYVVSIATGAENSPVIFRTYGRDYVIIQDDRTGSGPAQFNVQKPYLVFWGFEFRNINEGAGRTLQRPNMVYNNVGGHHNTYVNLSIHDGGVGFYNEPDADHVKIFGCIIYNIGYQGTNGDRGHGHAIYLRSNVGPVEANTNVMFNQFAYGVHAYSDIEGGGGLLKHILIKFNFAFNNGTNATNSLAANILLGGPDELASDDTLLMNNTYHSPGVHLRNVEVGYRTGTLQNGSVSVEQNYMVGGQNVLNLGYWQSNGVSAVNNELVTHGASDTLINLRDPLTDQYSWSGNKYWRSQTDLAWGHANNLFNWTGWKISTHLGSLDSQPFGGPPSQNQEQQWWVPDPTEPAWPASPIANRGIVWVYNWSHQSTTSFTPVEMPLVYYEIHDVQDLYGAPIMSGIYDGNEITLPISSVQPPTPVGLSAARSPSTGTDFKVYVLDYWP